MGIDAPSTDLTARIQARRKALVLSGEIDPHLPGERAVHGRQPGAHASFETTAAAQVLAAERRAARSRASEEVVEMDYTDYTGTGPVSEDADEPFEVGEGESPEVIAQVLHEFAGSEEYAERVVTTESALELRLAGIEAALVTLASESAERDDALARGLTALAQGLGEELGALHRTIDAHRLNMEYVPEPPVEKETRVSRWRHVLGIIFGPGSGPYE